MPVTLKYHGHSNFEILTGAHVLQLDPFYTSNALADVKADAAQPTHILLSHAHFDHIEDAESIAQRTGAPIIATYEVTQWFAKKGLKNIHPMNTGGGFNFDFGRATITEARHTSSFPDGSYGGLAGGFIIETGGKTIYFAGDTSVFSDMALIGKMWKIDLAILPIGDNFTMGPDGALLAIEMLKPKAVIPMHYNTFPQIKQDATAFGKRVEAQGIAKPLIMNPGETREI